MADNYNLMNDFMEQLHKAVHEHNSQTVGDFDRFVVTKFDNDGYFDRINCMTLEGMLALCTTIIETWMDERVKPETTNIARHAIIDDIMRAMRETLHDSVSEKYKS